MPITAKTRLITSGKEVMLQFYVMPASNLILHRHHRQCLDLHENYNSSFYQRRNYYIVNLEGHPGLNSALRIFTCEAARQLCCEQVLFLAASVCVSLSVRIESRKLLVGNWRNLVR